MEQIPYHLYHCLTLYDMSPSCGGGGIFRTRITLKYFGISTLTPKGSLGPCDPGPEDPPCQIGLSNGLILHQQTLLLSTPTQYRNIGQLEQQ